MGQGSASPSGAYHTRQTALPAPAGGEAGPLTAGTPPSGDWLGKQPPCRARWRERPGRRGSTKPPCPLPAAERRRPAGRHRGCRGQRHAALQPSEEAGWAKGAAYFPQPAPPLPPPPPPLPSWRGKRQQRLRLPPLPPAPPVLGVLPRTRRPRHPPFPPTSPPPPPLARPLQQRWRLTPPPWWLWLLPNPPPLPLLPWGVASLLGCCLLYHPPR